MLGKLKDAEKEIEKFRAEKVLQAAAAWRTPPATCTASPSSPVRCRTARGADDLRRLVLDVRGRIPASRPAVVALFTTAGGRPLTVIATNEAARERGLKAGDLVRTAAKTLGGGGGAQAGRRPGRRPETGGRRRGHRRRRAPGRRDGLTRMTAMRRGRRLAIDVGDARIGVASCDPDEGPRHPGGDRAGT